MLKLQAKKSIIIVNGSSQRANGCQRNNLRSSVHSNHSLQFGSLSPQKQSSPSNNRKMNNITKNQSPILCSVIQQPTISPSNYDILIRNKIYSDITISILILIVMETYKDQTINSIIMTKRMRN